MQPIANVGTSQFIFTCVQRYSHACLTLTVGYILSPVTYWLHVELNCRSEWVEGMVFISISSPAWRSLTVPQQKCRVSAVIQTSVPSAGTSFLSPGCKTLYGVLAVPSRFQYQVEFTLFQLSTLDHFKSVNWNNASQPDLLWGDFTRVNWFLHFAISRTSAANRLFDVFLIIDV